MNFLIELTQNKIFVSAAIAWFVAQVLKTIINFIFTKEWNIERLVGSGGMPSSHSSTVCALAVSVALVESVASTHFAIAAILAIIVMYDARGVRRETGEQARLLNMIMENLNRHDGSAFSEKRLKEYIGHTPLQVFMGAVLGIIIALIIK